MIYFNGNLDELSESIYLSDTISSGILETNIFINPRESQIKYLIGKIVIIDHPDYSEKNLEILRNNNCDIITRVFISDRYKYEPFIMRFCTGIQWNGMILDGVSSSNSDDIEALVKDSSRFDTEFSSDNKCSALYYPKIKGIRNDLLLDRKGNLTGLGWLQQQVGVNVLSDEKYSDLDLYKTKKVL